jgi:hypothetical protein
MIGPGADHLSATTFLKGTGNSIFVENTRGARPRLGTQNRAQKCQSNAPPLSAAKHIDRVKFVQMAQPGKSSVTMRSKLGEADLARDDDPAGPCVILIGPLPSAHRHIAPGDFRIRQ